MKTPWSNCCSERKLRRRSREPCYFQMTHRFFTDHTYSSSGQGVREIPPPPWTKALHAEFRYTYDVLEQALPSVGAEGLHFYFTKEAYFLPEYGPHVVAVLLQEERCKVPVYGRHVRAVLRNLTATPFLGFRPHLGFTHLEAVLSVEFLRDCYTSARSRVFLEHPPTTLPATIRAEPHIVYLPLGYHSQVELPQVPMANRRLDTFFAGEIRHEHSRLSYQHYLSTSKQEARAELWAILEELKRENRWNIDLGRIAANQTSHAAFPSYSEKMMHSRICVAPRGTKADTYRHFEGLRAGCLLVSNSLPKDPYLFPGAPMLIVDHWKELRGILERYARDTDTLEECRARSLTWWNNHLRPELLGRFVADELNEAAKALLH